MKKTKREMSIIQKGKPKMRFKSSIPLSKVSMAGYRPMVIIPKAYQARFKPGDFVVVRKVNPWDYLDENQIIDRFSKNIKAEFVPASEMKE